MVSLYISNTKNTLHQGKQRRLQKSPLHVHSIRSQNQIIQFALVCNCSENMGKVQKILAHFLMASFKIWLQVLRPLNKCSSLNMFNNLSTFTQNHLYIFQRRILQLHWYILLHLRLYIIQQFPLLLLILTYCLS